MKILELPFGAAGVNFEHSSRFCQSEGKFPLRTLINFIHMVNPYFLKSWLFGLFKGLQLGVIVAHFLNCTIFFPCTP
jgi:hypothetical protein